MVGRICTRSVYIAAPDETVLEAAQRMREAGVGTLVVVDVDRKPIGILTDRDIALRCVAQGLDPDHTPIKAVMTSPALSVPETTPIEDALKRMATVPMRRLVVTDAAGQLAGILALDDVLELLAEENETIGHMVRQLSSSRSTGPIVGYGK